MDSKKTNKEVLAKGVKTLAMSLGAIAVGPIILYNAFVNKAHPLFLVVVSFGVIVLFVAIFLILRGVKLIVSSFFD